MRLLVPLLGLAAGALLGCASPLNATRLILTPIAVAYTTTAASLGADNARDLAVCNGPETPPARSVACVERVTDDWADRNKALKAAFLALNAAEAALDLATNIELAGGAIDLGTIETLTSDAVKAWAALKALVDAKPAVAPAPSPLPPPAPASTPSIHGES